jgi:hypothetical protein
MVDIRRKNTPKNPTPLEWLIWSKPMETEEVRLLRKQLAEAEEQIDTLIEGYADRVRLDTWVTCGMDEAPRRVFLTFANDEDAYAYYLALKNRDTDNAQPISSTPLRQKLAVDFVEWLAKSGALGEPLITQLHMAAHLWASEKEHPHEANNCFAASTTHIHNKNCLKAESNENT